MIEEIHDILLQIINDDPDLQVKGLIAAHLAERKSPQLMQKLVALSKSPFPEVREIIALNLKGSVDILEELLEWFKVEDDLATRNKLFQTLSATINKSSDKKKLIKIASLLNSLIELDNRLNSLELLGYCGGSISEHILLSAWQSYRFSDDIRASVLRGVFHIAKKEHSLPIKLLREVLDLVGASYEPLKLRKIGLEALGEIQNDRVIDLLELIVETDFNHELRKLAIEIIGKRRIIELSPLIIEKLKYDGISEVRAAAANALGVLTSFDAIPELSETLENDISFFVREAAAEALGNLKSQQALTSLLKGIEDHDSYVRDTSAWSIKQLQPSSSLVLHICKLLKLKTRGFHIRKGMIVLLSRMSSIPEALVCLVETFREDNSPLRELILETLENFVPKLKNDYDFLKNDLRFILNTLSTSESFSLRAAICSFLGHLKETGTFSSLLDRLLFDEDALVQRQAAWAIANIPPSDHTADQIHLLLKDKKYRNKVPLFLEILTGWADLSDLSTALEYLKSPDVEWRRRSVELISSIINNEEQEFFFRDDLVLSIIDTLISVLREDEANTVRSAAAHTLGYFYRYEGLITPSLFQAIKNDRIYTVRELAAEAIGYLGGTDAIPGLKRLINHRIEKDPSIRYFASLAILNIESQLNDNK
ncbi:MAG: HEAT repeat domain-containing protein [Candidatus Hodarchaeales archaeon]